MEYKPLIEKMIEAYAEMIGEVAYTQVDRIEGLEMDEAHHIKSEADSETVEKVLDKFKDVMGEGAYGVARKTVKEVYAENESIADLDLPQKIKPKEVKAESFASAL